MLKNKKIKTKVLIILLAVAILSQIIIAGISYGEIISLTNYSKEASYKLGSTASDDSKNALKNQAEEYLSKLADEQSTSVNSILERVSGAVSSIADSMESIYKNSSNFVGTNLPLPEETKEGSLEDINSATSKIYAIDRNNSSNDENITNVTDRAVQEGDTAIINFKGFIDGAPMEGEEAENYSIRVGSGEFILDFEKQIVGHNVGDEFDVTIKFPKNYSDSNLADKEAVFKVKLQQIHENIALAYDPGYYGTGKSVYRTSISKYSALSSDEKNTLKQNNIVVSNNILPNDIKKEMKVLSNIDYIVKPIYANERIIDNIYIGTKSGINYHYSVYSSANKYDPIYRKWYHDAEKLLKAGVNSGIWQETYKDIQGRTCVTCSKAFKNSNGEIAGVVGIDILISTIANDVLAMKIGENGYSFVVNANGKIIMHPDYTNENFNANPLDSTISENYRQLLNLMISGEKGIKQVEIDNKSYYAAFAPLVQTGSSIAILGSLDDIVAPMKKTSAKIAATSASTSDYIAQQLNQAILRFTIIIIVFILLIIFVASMLAKSFTKPIIELASGASKIGKGDLDYKIKIDSYDEIGDLAMSFNKMTKDLKEYMENLKETTAAKERIDHELNIAKVIQENMLPCIFPPFPTRDDFDIFATMNPAKQVGGDFYDFFLLDESHVAIVIADVSGKGVAAALFMVIAKTLIKNYALYMKDPALVFNAVNNQLCENNKAQMFVTAFMGVLDINTGELVYANAGHCPPLIYREKGEFEFLKVKPGFVLAGMEDINYKSGKTNIGAGDMVYLYTDGVIEATNPNEDLFTENRLKEVLNNPNTKKLDITTILKKVKEEVDTFANGAEQADDITMLLLKYTAQGINKDSENK